MSPDTHSKRGCANVWSRRRFFHAGGALGLSTLLPGCSNLADKPISIAAHTWVGYEPMFLAHREGWLDPKLVRLQETQAATESMALLAAGKVDGAALTLDETLKARQNGQKLSVVMIFNISAGADMLVARPDIKELRDLKGKRVGFEQSSVGELLLAEVLQAARLSHKDITPVPINVDKQAEAWKRQELDAVVTYEPVASELLAHGAVRLFDSRQIPNTILDVLAIRSDLPDSRAAAVRHLIQSHFKGLNHLTRNPQDAAYRMAGHLKLQPAEVLPAFKGLVLPDATNNLRLLAGASPEMFPTARELSKVMARSGLLKQEDSLDGLIRAEFLPSGT